MAKQTITVLTDDLDGGDAHGTVEFGLDGVVYSIDLSEKNAGKLRSAFAPYLKVASKVGRNASPSESRMAKPVGQGRASRDQNQAIREWAIKQGYEVSARGRIPATVVEAFHAKR